MKKKLDVLYNEKYGRKPYSCIGSPSNKYDKIEYWQRFEVNYRELETKGLLLLLNYVRKELSLIDYYGFNMEYNDKLNKIYLALKTELDTREHIPNKKEGKELRKIKS